MKKLFTIILLALFTVGFSSCKKDYTCECVETYSPGQALQPTVTTNNYRDSRRNAQNDCESKSYTKTNPTLGVTIRQDCRLK